MSVNVRNFSTGKSSGLSVAMIANSEGAKDLDCMSMLSKSK